MNFRLIGVAILFSCANAVQAQPSVTLYGVADTSVRYLTGASKDNSSSVSLTNGAISQSRWGLIGTEDLGAGNKALFRLESGFGIPNGKLSNSGVIFNRFAYVGLSNDVVGQITAGQQNNPVALLLQESWDPLTVGNYLQNEWVPVAFGGFLHGENNTVNYSYIRGAFKVRIGYGFGNIAGSLATGSMRAVTLSYDPSPLGAAAGFVQTVDATGKRQTAENIQFRYQSRDAGLWLGYYHSSDETGAVDAFLSGGNPVPDAANPRRDNAFVAGASYLFAPAFSMKWVLYYDQATQIRGVTGGNGKGKRITPVVLAQYFVSKQVTLYGTVDYNRMVGAAAKEAPNGKDQLGVAAGMRYVF